jgi:hypothetical protein
VRRFRLQFRHGTYEERPLMLGDILGEIFSAIIGDALLGWLWPNRPKRPWPPPEGQWNASLGSVAGFLGGLSILFVGAMTIVAARGRQDDGLVLFVMLGRTSPGLRRGGVGKKNLSRFVATTKVRGDRLVVFTCEHRARDSGDGCSAQSRGPVDAV